jgi:hypothetical protein
MSRRSGRLRDIYEEKEFEEFKELQEFRMFLRNRSFILKPKVKIRRLTDYADFSKLSANYDLSYIVPGH